MKKMISVPVGAKPAVKTRKSMLGGRYLDYGYIRHHLYPESSLSSILTQLKSFEKEYGNDYTDLKFRSENDCGCVYDCSCSPSYILYGTRLETDVEYEYRILKEFDEEAKRKERDRKEYERLKSQFGDKND